MFDNALRMPVHHPLKRYFLPAARILTVPHIQLLFCFVARHPHRRSVGDDNEIAGEQVAHVARLVLPHEQPGHPGGQPTQDLPGGVDHVPLRR